MIRHFVILLSVTYGSFANLMLYKGSSCTWEGASGKCVSALVCPSAAMNIARRKFPPVCTYEGKVPIICCTDSNLVHDKKFKVESTPLTMLTKMQGNTKKSREKAKDKCLEYTQKFDYKCNRRRYGRWNRGNSHGVSGRHSLRNEFPHMALLGFGHTIDAASWLCGGSVISDRFILTAAHCVYSLSVGEVKYFALGILKRSDPQEKWKIYNVKRAIRHPRYNPPSIYHDIALLESDRQIVFSSEVLPACLHVNGSIGDRAVGTGWGALGHKKQLADTLQAVPLLRKEDNKCSKEYPANRNWKFGYDSATQVCYGDTGDGSVPTDTCEGDSGGPLQTRKIDQCVPTILGVTSYGHQCGGRGGSGIYTRVSYYVPWIQDIVWP